MSLRSLPFLKLYSRWGMKIFFSFFALTLVISALYGGCWLLLAKSATGIFWTWLVALGVALGISLIFSVVVIEFMLPLTQEVSNGLSSEISWSKRTSRHIQEKWDNFSQQNLQKKHEFVASLEKTNQLDRRILDDIKGLVLQLQKIAASLQTQSTRVKDMTSSLAEMSAAVKSVATHSEASVATSKSSEGDAKRGGEVVNKIIKHMNQITKTVSKTAEVILNLRKRSDEIGEIINVIEDIAEQTNLLALNAAIEAARAGVQGRGFAVVADHVRSLAEKTTHATKEIATTLSSIQEETSKAVAAMDEGVREIDIGAGFAVQAGVSLRKIVAGTQHVTEMISMIASAAEKQSLAANAITGLVAEVSCETDGTCEASKTALSGTVKLEEQMAQLSKLLEDFIQMWATNRSDEELFSLGEAANKELLICSERLEEIYTNMARLAG